MRRERMRRKMRKAWMILMKRGKMTERKMMMMMGRYVALLYIYTHTHTHKNTYKCTLKMFESYLLKKKLFLVLINKRIIYYFDDCVIAYENPKYKISENLSYMKLGKKNKKFK